MKRKINEDEKLWKSFKRQSIQEAVIQLLCREGLDSVTMERVAQEAGIAKGTVYLHYKDKQELLDQVKEDSLEPLILRMDEVVASDMPPDRKLRAWSLRYLGYFDERRDLFRVLLYEREVVRIYASRYQSDRYRRLLNGVEKIINEGMERGVLRQLPAQKSATMFVESNFAMMNQRLRSKERAPVESDADLVADVLLHGLSPAPAIRRRS